MLAGLGSDIGLEIVVWLQAHGNAFFDALAEGLHIAGQDLFYLAVLTLVFWSINRQLGLRLLFALLVATATVEVLKAIFQVPRPFIAHPDQVVPLVEQGGFAFPSGHVMIGLIVWGYMAYWLRRRAAWALVAVYLLLIGWGRMYTGVHYPEDVIGGLAGGVLVLWLYGRFAEPVARLWGALKLTAQAGLVVIVSLAAVSFLWDSADGLAAAGILFGGGVGLIIEGRWVRFTVPTTPWRRLICFAVGVVLALALMFGLRALFDSAGAEQPLRLLRYALVGLFAIAIWPWLCTRLGWMGVRPRGDPPPDRPAL